MYLTNKDFKRVDKALASIDKKVTIQLKKRGWKALAYLNRELDRIREELKDTKRFAKSLNNVYKRVK